MTEASAAVEQLLRQKRGVQALDRCRLELERTPDDPDLLRLLGRALAELGRLEESAAAFERALTRAPDDIRTLSNLGRVALDRDQPEQARDWFERALAQAPDSLRALRGLSTCLSRLGDDPGAEAVLSRALRLDPDDVATITALGSLHVAAGRFTQALAVIDAGLERRAGSALLLRARGTTLVALGREREAHAAFEAALAADPMLTTSRTQLAELLRLSGFTVRARAVLDAAPPEASDALELLIVKAAVAAETGALAEAIGHLDRAIALEPARLDLGSSRLFFLSHQLDVGAEELAEQHRAWGRAALAHAAPRPAPQRSGASRMRVGYLSADFKDHVVSRFMTPVLRAHDAARVEVVLIATTRAYDAHAADLRRDHRFLDVAGRSERDARDRIAELGLDVLVDLTSHAGSHVSLLAERLAPLQASYLGYPGTTGLAPVDVHITDADADPPGTEADFSERLLRLPRTAWAYVLDPTLAAVPARDPERPLTFGCFNRLTKIGDTLLATWAAILERVPGSRLLLKCRPFAEPAMREHLAARLTRLGIAERVELRPWEPTFAAALGAHSAIDIALDTFPYQGTTTTCDALWMGVPVVSWQGATPASRVAQSLLGAVGLAELAAPTREAYIERAAELALDTARLAEMRHGLRQRFDSGPLGDAVGLARALERAYEDELNAVGSLARAR